MPAGLDGNQDPISTAARDRVLDRVATEIVDRRVPGRPTLVAIDGIDGSGKSTMADELAGRLLAGGVPVVRSTIDSFHHPRSIRWARGSRSPVGFYLDSHDLAALRERLLDPFTTGDGAIYRIAAFDEPSDQPVDPPPQRLAGDEVLLFDGIFLCRRELRRYWDVVVFVEAKARVDLTRVERIVADAPASGPELVNHVLDWVGRLDRYTAGMRYYLDTEDPMASADLVIDNNDLANPFIVDG